MSKKLSDKQIVGEEMYSVKRSLTANIPPPPTNPDGSFTTVDQMVNNRRLKNYREQQEQQAAYNEAVAKTEAASRASWNGSENNNAYDSERERRSNIGVILLSFLFASIAFVVLFQFLPLFSN